MNHTIGKASCSGVVGQNKMETILLVFVCAYFVFVCCLVWFLKERRMRIRVSERYDRSCRRRKMIKVWNFFKH